MDSYIGLMGDAIGFIEEHVGEPLTTADVAGRFNMSPFHFGRLFSAVTGMGLKAYVTGRKLAHALARLRDTGDSVLDIALDLGFGSPEVFTRAFKRRYGMTPTAYRESKPSVESVEMAFPVDRELISHEGMVAVKASIVHCAPLILRGETLAVNTGDECFHQTIGEVSLRLMRETAGVADATLDHSRFLCAVKCQGREDGWYDVTVGKPVVSGECSGPGYHRIPGGWHACFVYRGSMPDIRTTFESDLYRWLAVRGIMPNPEGPGMISVYETSATFGVPSRILVPVLLSGQ